MLPSVLLNAILSRIEGRLSILKGYWVNFLNDPATKGIFFRGSTVDSNFNGVQWPCQPIAPIL